MTIPPNLAFEDTGFNVPDTAAGTKRALASRFGDSYVNAADFNIQADNASFNSGPGLQAAINVAFHGGISGTSGSISNPYVNRILIIPRGTYHVSPALRIKNVNGPVVMGCGRATTVIGAFGALTDAGLGNGTRPHLILENVQNGHFEGFTVGGADRNVGSVGIELYCSGGGNCDFNLFKEVDTGELSYAGFAVGGSGSDQQVRSNIFLCCPGGTIFGGVRVRSEASIGHIYIQGGSGGGGLNPNNPSEPYLGTYVPGSDIGNGPAGISVVNGQVAFIAAQSIGSSVIDIMNASKFPMTICGARIESNFAYLSNVVSTNGPTGTTGPAGPVFVSNVVLSGATTVQPLTASEWTNFEHGVSLLPAGREHTQMFDCFNGGTVHAVRCAYSARWVSHATTVPDYGSFARVASDSSFLADGIDTQCFDSVRTLYPDYAPGVDLPQTGALVGGYSGNGTVVFGGVFNFPHEASGALGWKSWLPVLGFTGSFVGQASVPLTFATLPPANRMFAGQSFVITDSSVAMSGHYWDLASGGGSFVVPVFCSWNGTTASWRIA